MEFRTKKDYNDSVNHRQSDLQLSVQPVTITTKVVSSNPAHGKVYSIDLFFKLPVNRYLAINIEGKIGQLTVRRTSSFIIDETVSQKSHVLRSKDLFSK
jgi:hypothetical protein